MTSQIWLVNTAICFFVSKRISGSRSCASRLECIGRPINDRWCSKSCAAFSSISWEYKRKCRLCLRLRGASPYQVKFRARIGRARLRRAAPPALKHSHSLAAQKAVQVKVKVYVQDREKRAPLLCYQAKT